MLSRSDLVKALSGELGMLPIQLELIIRTAPLRYKVFTIPKRDGSPRTVAQPAREVKAIQRWLVNDLNTVLPVHQAATAYRKGTSIKINAAKHVQSSFILKMDFKNFFPSIEFKDLCAHLQKYASEKYDESAIHMIARLCSWAPNRSPPLRLCIGAPSSPLLSNSVLYDFDCAMEVFATRDEVTYTRYADDLTFSSSSPESLKSYPEIVRKVILSLPFPVLNINTKKTVFASKAERRLVTGITLSSTHDLSVGRDRKRLARAMFHHFSRGLLDAKGEEHMRGLLSFIDHIEPGFSVRLKARMSQRDDKD
jgi:RNA-directed DNA polymerase